MSWAGQEPTDLRPAGYRGHNALQRHRFCVFTTGQKRGVTPAIKRLMKRRSAVEPVIGHLKHGHLMDRNYLAHEQGDAINPVLAAAGYNFRLILKWIRLLWLQFWMTSVTTLAVRSV
jgi:IS5 family transposase